MKIITAIPALAYFHVCHAENLSITETIAYKGKLSESKVFMSLSETNGKITGGYHYAKYRTAIPLLGSSESNYLKLKEKGTLSEAEITAEINNEFMQGVWKSDKAIHKLHAVALSRSYKELISSVGAAKKKERKSIIIEYIGGGSQTFEVETLTDTISIVFEDHNFDGFPDLRVLEAGTGANRSYIAWTYIPSKRTFEYSKEISTLSNPKVLHSEESILSFSREGCCRYLAWKILGKEKHAAEFEYEKLSGVERVTDLRTGITTVNPITQEYFERKYLHPMGANGL